LEASRKREDGSPTTPSSPTTQPDQALTSAAGDADLSEDPADLPLAMIFSRRMTWKIQKSDNWTEMI